MISLSLYFAFLSFVGLWKIKKAGNFEEYFLSNRKLGLFETSLTLASTWVDAAIVLGFAGYCYSFGYEALWIAIPTSMGVYTFSIFFSKRVNLKKNGFTVGEVIRNAYGERVSIISSLFILLYSIALIAANLMAGGYIMESIFKVPFTYGILLTLAFTLSYTVLGGFKKVVETDVIQFFLIIIGLIIVFFFSIKAVGGWSKVREIALTYPRAFSKWEIVSFFIAFSIPFWADPSFYQRCSAARSPKVASLGIAFVGLVDSIMTFISFGIGLAGICILGTTITPDSVLPSVIDALLPKVLKEFVGIAILSAVMSTADSYLLIAGGVIAHDILRSLKVRYLDEVKIAKMGAIISAFLSFLSISIFTDIIDTALFAFSLFVSSSFIPLVIALLSSRKHDFETPSMIGMLAGGATVVIWKLWRLGDTSISVFYGLAVSGVVWLLLLIVQKVKFLKTKN